MTEKNCAGCGAAFTTPSRFPDPVLDGTNRSRFRLFRSGEHGPLCKRCAEPWRYERGVSAA